MISLFVITCSPGTTNSIALATICSLIVFAYSCLAVLVTMPFALIAFARILAPFTSSSK